MSVKIAKSSHGRGYTQSVRYSYQELSADLPDEAQKALRDIPGYDRAQYGVTTIEGTLYCYVEWPHRTEWFVFSENDAQWTECRSWESVSA